MYKSQTACSLLFYLKAQDFDVYETYVNGQITPTNKLYRKLGIGGKLAELLARPDVAQYFEVVHGIVLEYVRKLFALIELGQFYECCLSWV